jgi:hypothetical protein
LGLATPPLINRLFGFLSFMDLDIVRIFPAECMYSETVLAPTRYTLGYSGSLDAAMELITLAQMAVIVCGFFPHVMRSSMHPRREDYSESEEYVTSVAGTCAFMAVSTFPHFGIAYIVLILASILFFILLVLVTPLVLGLKFCGCDSSFEKNEGEKWASVRERMKEFNAQSS